ncbi:MAG TPA: sigma-70 family RNA polymerase sigma factor [Bryobacteraceae bacterium]|nr:sigma-70 family RNA polymerase sigma factor [Bryobacteraceae bacterium]
MLNESAGKVTLLLAEMRRGNNEALSSLIPLVYNELRRLAAHCLRDERSGHTLQPTALVHEAYLRLAGQNRAGWQDRAQFMGVAAQVMRRILVDYARQKTAAKRGGNVPVVLLDEPELPGVSERSEEMLAVDEALARLADLDPQQARIVEMRYFGGMTVEETAEALAIAPRTVKRDWAMAKAWLRVEFTSKDQR